MALLRLFHKVLFILQFLHLIQAFKIDVPSNFYGSSEVFSGYLSDYEVYVEAFTLHNDHVSISGSTSKVENTLENINSTGKKLPA